jgi:putative ABC transport system substrate-binding protein
MMGRRTFIGAVAGSLVVAAFRSTAQQGERIYQVGILSLGTFSASPAGISAGFIPAMRELNYVEGRNLVVKRASAEFKIDRLPSLAADLVQAKVDVIVTTSTAETLAAKSATSVIPIVMTLAPDPVENGLVTSLARPGGNVTGLMSVVPGITEKYVELLHEAVPSATRFAVVSGTTLFPEIRRELEGAARRLGIILYFTGIQVPDEIDPALTRARKDGAGGIIAPLSAVTSRYRVQLVQLALKHRLPGIYWDREYVEAGGLMSYGASLNGVGRRAAYFVDKILKGSKPADLPVEWPTKFELVINLNTAKALGLAVPQSLLVRADEVIQ